MAYATRLDNQLISSPDWSSEIIPFDLLKNGLHTLEFTNWTNNDEPKVKANSAIEVNGTINVFDTEESISGDLTGYSGTVFIRTSASGLVYDTSLTELPTWDSQRKGYYDVLNNRIIGSFNYSFETYTLKRLYLDEYDPDIELEEGTGDIFIDSNLIITSPSLNISIEQYTYGMGRVNGETENTIYIYRTADNKTYEKLYENVGALFVPQSIFYINGRILAVYSRHTGGNDTTFFPLISTDLTHFSDPLWGINNLFNYSGFEYTNGVWLIIHGYRTTSHTYFSYSSDCSTWTTYDAGFPRYIASWTTYNNLFIHSYGISNDQKYIYYSSDGASWNDCVINTSSILITGGDFEEVNGVLYFVGDITLSSTDGINFTEVSI